MAFMEFNTEVILALIKVKKAYLVQEIKTTAANADDSLMLAVELYDKCEGSAKLLFASMEAQSEYLFQGKGIEILQLLIDRFGCISVETTRKL